MTLIQAAILQITVEKNLTSIFNNEQKNIAVTDMNTEMITKTTDFLSRINSVLTKTSDVKIKSISFDHN